MLCNGSFLYMQAIPMCSVTDRCLTWTEMLQDPSKLEAQGNEEQELEKAQAKASHGEQLPQDLEPPNKTAADISDLMLEETVPDAPAIPSSGTSEPPLDPVEETSSPSEQGPADDKEVLPIKLTVSPTAAMSPGSHKDAKEEEQQRHLQGPGS